MNHQATTRPPADDYLFDADFGDDFSAPAKTTPEDIRKNASVHNGGEQALVPCVKCGGSGQTRWGMCFRCKGKGKIGMRSAAASKASATRRQNEAERRVEFAENNRAEITYCHRRADKGSSFYASFVQKIGEWGYLTENQMAIVHKDMAKDAEFYAAKKAEREAAAPVVPTQAIEALFAKATEKLAKTAIFRTVDVTINLAPATGRNPGALYVKDTETKDYLGKIVGGKFHKAYGAKDVTEALQRVAADPTAEAIAYARKFSACCCCGKTLRDPVSVLAVVGPICGPRWGLDHLRMEAAAMLAAEKAEGEGK